jgi:DNA-binding FadR family transcriptional regulator
MTYEVRGKLSGARYAEFMDSGQAPGAKAGIVAPPWPARSSRLGVSVVAYLVDQVVGGKLPPGSSFPPEPELCTIFGVSRTVIRESMRLLEEKGLAQIRQGQGTTVAPADRWNMLDPVVLDAAIRNDRELAILDDLVQVRVELEVLMARKAAARIDAPQLAELAQIVAQLDRELSNPDAYLVTDTVFHDAIMRASGNALARTVVRAVHGHARASSRYNGPIEAIDLADTHRGHLTIYERLAAGDAAGAAAAMRDHILDSWLVRKAARDQQTA